MYVCHGKFQIASFLFLDGIEPFFGCQFSMWHSTKLFSSIFDLGPLTSKIYSPKFLMARVWCKPGNLRTQKLAWHHCDVITYHRSWISMGRQTCRNSIQGTTMLANKICARRGVKSPTGLSAQKSSSHLDQIACIMWSYHIMHCSQSICQTENLCKPKMWSLSPVNLMLHFIVMFALCNARCH